MKKLCIYLLIGMLVAPFAYGGMALEQYTLQAHGSYSQSQTFDNPARSITITVNSSEDDLFINFNGAAISTGDTCAIEADESISWTFDFGNQVKGVTELHYIGEIGKVSNFRVWAITY